MLLRRNQRELVEKVECSKDELRSNIEKTDEMLQKLEELVYEKRCIENEVLRIQKLDTQELSCLGIPINGEKEVILQKFEEEFQARSSLKNELVRRENELQAAKYNLLAVEEKLQAFSQNLKKMLVAGDSLNCLLPSPE